MAAEHDPHNAERHKQWYDDDLTEINEPMRRLLETYSKVEPNKVVEHVNDLVGIPPELPPNPQLTFIALSAPVASPQIPTRASATIAS